VLARKQPTWAMAAELVETERTWARTVARVEPAWAERIGAHLVTRSWAEPWWDESRAEVVTDERVSLYGLPIVTGRRTSYARIDPVESRRLFLEHALVGEEWPGAPAFVERTRQRMEEVRALEDRVRRRDLLAGDEARLAWWDARIPHDVTGGRAFQRWWRKAGRRDPELLDVPLSVLLDRSGGPVDLRDWPEAWQQDDLRLPLRYVFDPGQPDDGVTVLVPLVALNRVRADGFDWNVPGLRHELVTALVRSLPKVLRRSFGPAPDVAAEVLAVRGPSDGPLLDVVARHLAARSGEPVRAAMWDLDRLPRHLRMAFEVVGPGGVVRGGGHDLAALQRELHAEVAAAIAEVLPGIERHQATSWDFGEIPHRVEAAGGVVGYPSLVDEGGAVGLVVLDSAAAQARNMWQGTLRLLRLAVPLPGAHLQRRLSNDTKLAMAGWTPVGDVLDDCTGAALDDIITRAGGPAYDAAGFAALVGEARASLLDRVVSLATIAGGVLAAAEGVQVRVAALDARDRQGVLEASLADVRQQLDRLVGPGFVAVTGSAHLPDLLRYLEATSRRLDRLPADVRRDRERMAAVAEVQSRYERLADQAVDGTATPSVLRGLGRVRWMLEELRVSLWAQALGTSVPVSEERIARLLDAMVDP
jgi:ATP-dependent helicase HrpA